MLISVELISLSIYVVGMFIVLLLKRYNKQFNPPHIILVAILWPVFIIAIILDFIAVGVNKLWKL